ncbi:hypothetical protein [Sandaracinus amylolyticus]|uniref:hypothetical protein n=1 Tax=Sandaracinus amylolyticus TaxID=927083 RepID=UPI001F470559|nr:hypothetical protein [Sandaracinus amylolyticus]UJR85603.1 Hypothetical protein I5071_76830 [Sandaracinus amylolyticus]
MGRLASWLLALVVLALASRAHAHPLVDDAERQLDEARFGAALALFDRAAQGDDLDVSDVVRVLEGRALALRALGREGEIEIDLRRLAALRPQHTFSARVPPEIAHRFRVLRERGAERLRARVQVRRDGAQVRLELALTNDPGGLVREATLFARAGDGPWSSSSEGALALEARDGERVDYYARVIGIGGALIVEHGAEDAPLPALVTSHVEVAPGAVAEPSDPWPWILAGSGVIATAGIVIAIVLVATAQPGDDTRLSAPRPVEMP